jgi:hypothetical protein
MLDLANDSCEDFSIITKSTKSISQDSSQIVKEYELCCHNVERQSKHK